MEVGNMPKAIELFNDINKAKDLLDFIDKSQTPPLGGITLKIEDNDGKRQAIVFTDKQIGKDLISDLKHDLECVIVKKMQELKKY